MIKLTRKLPNKTIEINISIAVEICSQHYFKIHPNLFILRHMNIMVSGFISSSNDILYYFELKIIQPQNYTGFILKIISFLGVAAVVATHYVSHSRYELLEDMWMYSIKKKYIIIDIYNHLYHCLEAMFHLLHFFGAFWLVKNRRNTVRIVLFLGTIRDQF